MTTIDISPEAVEQLAHHDDIGGDALRFAPTLRALSAALTQSRTETAAAREHGMREAMRECQKVADEAKSYGLPQMTMGANTCRDAILAAIPKGGEA